MESVTALCGTFARTKQSYAKFGQRDPSPTLIPPAADINIGTYTLYIVTPLPIPYTQYFLYTSLVPKPKKPLGARSARGTRLKSVFLAYPNRPGLSRYTARDPDIFIHLSNTQTEQAPLGKVGAGNERESHVFLQYPNRTGLSR